MATQMQLKKYANQSGFVDHMGTLGFTLGPDSFWFFRRRGELIDLVAFWIKSSGNWVKIPVACLVGEIALGYDMNRFPKGFLKSAPMITDAYISKGGVEIAGQAWRISNDEFIAKMFDELLSIMTSQVDTWFRSIDSREKIYTSMSERMRESELGGKVKNIVQQ